MFSMASTASERCVCRSHVRALSQLAFISACSRLQAVQGITLSAVHNLHEAPVVPVALREESAPSKPKVSRASKEFADESANAARQRAVGKGSSWFGHDPGNDMDRYKVYGLQFMHIPKNAGSLIEDIGHAATPSVNWGLYLAAFWDQSTMPDGNICNGWHVPPKYHFDKDSIENGPLYNDPRIEDVFCFVRDPFERAISEYTYLLTQNWAKTLSAELGTGLTEKPECTPEGLNFFLKTVMMMIVDDGQRFIHDCHFVPQTDYIFDGDKQWCNKVLKVSRMPHNFNKLMKHQGYNISIGDDERKNDSKKQCSMTADDLDDSTKSLMQAVYAADFAHLEF